jgi:putative phage-type endonuclease
MTLKNKKIKNVSYHMDKMTNPNDTPITEWLTLVDNWLSPPEDHVQLEQWLESADELAYAYEFSDAEERLVEQILRCYEIQYRRRLELLPTLRPPRHQDLPSPEQLEELTTRKQTEQRTEAWYRQMSEIISASELGQLFAAPRQRAKLVMSKTTPYVPRNAPLAVYSEQMSAFDWGIRFEPVVKQIYIEKYGATLKELGRLHHPTHPTCTASPDGLVYHCPKGQRTGRLLEIKCPVSREIDGTIPKDYYTQMQMQLHVTGLRYCDYIEAEFASPYQMIQPKQGPTEYSGMIALVFIRNPDGSGTFDYRYSPVNAPSDWQPILEDHEEVVEWIPWRLMKWSEQVVARNEEWWEALQPVLRTFWEDVEKAKRGEFTIPESTRPNKRAKTTEASPACLIQFQRLDENGAPYVPSPVPPSPAPDVHPLDTEMGSAL